MALELVLEGFLELLAEYVDPPPWQLVVQVGYDEVQRHLHLYVHLGLGEENFRAVGGGDCLLLLRKEAVLCRGTAVVVGPAPFNG